MNTFYVSKDENNCLLGDVMKKRGFSRRLITKLKRIENGINKNGLPVRTVDTVFENDIITLKDTVSDSELIPNGDLNVKILYEDNDVIVFDKPALMPCHPSIKHREDTLGNFFAYLYPELTFRPINRLDRDTSGCVLVGKNSHAAHFLQNKCRKIYCGMTADFPFSGGRICVPIARESESIIKRCVRNDGKYAVTNYKVIKRTQNKTLIKFDLETGRTHQIRVHMAYKGYPLLGDDMYGGDNSVIKTQALHCCQVDFVSPENLQIISVRSEIPKDWEM